MDDTDAAPITDPASVLIGLGAACGLIAAMLWIRLVRRIAERRPESSAPWSDLSTAATFTALALGLASGGYLLGRFTGRY